MPNNIEKNCAYRIKTRDVLSLGRNVIWLVRLSLDVVDVVDRTIKNKRLTLSPSLFRSASTHANGYHKNVVTQLLTNGVHHFFFLTQN